MIKITTEEADKIIHERLHMAHHKHVVAKYKGQWFDIRGLSRQQVANAVVKEFGYMVRPDCFI